jgi:hypothetical protein
VCVFIRAKLTSIAHHIHCTHTHTHTRAGDLTYINHYPHLEKYISLFPNDNGETEDEGGWRVCCSVQRCLECSIVHLKRVLNVCQMCYIYKHAYPHHPHTHAHTYTHKHTHTHTHYLTRSRYPATRCHAQEDLEPSTQGEVSAVRCSIISVVCGI